jgi:hypothetical protein
MDLRESGIDIHLDQAIKGFDGSVIVCSDPSH